jgi:hypothetical protein
MKHFLFTLALVLLTHFAFAQKPDAAKFEVGVGGTFAKPKIIPALDKLGLAQITVKYNLTTTTRTVGKENSTGAVAGAKLTAFLETTDGKLTDADFQEITDHFYTYFQKKLKAGGIDTVAWGTIASKDFFSESEEKPKETGHEGSANAWATSFAHQGNNLYSGGIAFTFGRAKKAAKFAEELGAPAAYFNLTVDFADVMLDVDIKSTSHEGLFTIEKTRSWKYNSAVRPQVSVVPTDATSNTLFWNEKYQAETLLLRKDINADVVYQDNVSQDPSRMKNSAWAFAKEMNPVVIETTRDKYKSAAKKALENYADAFVDFQKSIEK